MWSLDDVEREREKTGILVIHVVLLELQPTSDSIHRWPFIPNE